MSGTAATRPVRPHTKWGFAAVFGLVGALVVGIIVLAFVWPAATAKAQNLPVGLSGPSAQVRAFETALQKEGVTTFAFQSVGSREDAIRAIKQRTIYGAVLLGDSPEVLTSSAAGAASNQALRGVATAIQTQISTAAEAGLIAKLQQAGTAIAGLQAELKAVAAGATPPAAGSAGSSSSGSSAAAAVPTVMVTDVVALSSDDPTGAGLNAASFPLVLGGMLGGVLMSLLVVGVVRRLLALIVYGIAAGAAVTLVLQTWLHVLQRDWLLNAAGFGLAMLATAALVVGCTALIGTPGIAIGSVISLLIGNPIAGAAIPYQFITRPWGDVGQYFVPGAASSLVRALSYFPDADVSKQWLVLGAWAVGGMLLAMVGHFRSRAAIRVPAGELEPTPASGGAARSA